MPNQENTMLQPSILPAANTFSSEKSFIIHSGGNPSRLDKELRVLQKKCEEITRLEINRNFKDRLNTIKSCTNLTKLTISSELGDNDLVSLIGAISKLPQLTMLDLSNNNITGDGAMKLCDLIDNKALKSLTTLNLQNNLISEKNPVELLEKVCEVNNITLLLESTP